MLRNVLPIYLVIFIDVVGFTFLIPLLPALAQRYGATPFTMGLLVSTTALCAALSSPVWGKLSDRLGRKAVLMSSQGFSLAGYFLLAIASSVPVLFVSRAIEGFGGGNLGVAQSYIVDVVAEEQREKALAWGAAAFGFGFVAGPLASGFLLRLGLSVPFWVATGLEAVNMLLTFLMLRGSKPRAQAAGDLSRLAAALKNPGLLNVMTRQLLFIFSYTYFFTIFGLYVANELHRDAATASALLGVAGAVGAGAQIFLADRLSRRLGTLALSEWMFALSLVAYVLLGFVSDVRSFAALLVVWAIPGAILQPTMTTLLAERAPEDQRGAVLGLADSLDNASLIAAPAIGSAILSADARLIGVVPALCALAALLLGFAAKRRSAGASG